MLVRVTTCALGDYSGSKGDPKSPKMERFIVLLGVGALYRGACTPKQLAFLGSHASWKEHDCCSGSGPAIFHMAPMLRGACEGCEGCSGYEEFEGQEGM